MEDKVREVTAPPVPEVKYPVRKKRTARGLGMGPVD
jgi:hypothetical protein